MTLPFDPLIFLGLFLLYVAVYAVYVKYTLKVTEKRPFAAANYAFMVYLFNAIGVISYMSNWWYVGAVISGSWVGTYWTVRAS